MSQNRSETIEALRVIAHQWRQPLNLISVEAMNLIVQASLQEKVDSDEILKSAQSISDQVQRMSDVLKSLLDLGKVQKRKELFCINDLLKTLQDFFNEQLKKEHISLEIEFPSQQFNILGFYHNLQEVLVNLIANAKDAFLQNPQIQNREISLQVSLFKNTYRFSVRDNAGGIPPSIREKIFEPNFSTKKAQDGFGIGLHVAKIIIEQEFGGTLSYEALEDGSHFLIEIPSGDLNNLKYIQ